MAVFLSHSILETQIQAVLSPDMENPGSESEGIPADQLKKHIVSDS